MNTFITRFLKVVISVVAVANLILLLALDYNLPGEATEQIGSAAGIGTTLSLPSRFPAVTDLDLPNIGKKLIEAGSVKAVVADGNDITDRIVFEAESDKRDERIAVCTFSVQGDKDKEPVSITVNVPVTLNRPVLILEADSVMVAKDTVFDPLDYVSEAVDASGVNIIDNTSVIGEVDTSVPGTYQIALQAKDTNGYISDPKTLTVVVS